MNFTRMTVVIVSMIAMLALFSYIGYVGYVAITHLGKVPEGVEDVSVFFGTFSAMLAVVIAVLTVIIAAIPLIFLFINKHGIKTEVNEQLDSIRKELTDTIASTVASTVAKEASTLFQKSLGKSLEEYTVQQDQLRYLTELILSHLWNHGARRIDEATPNQKLDVFIKELARHLKDTFTFTQLRSPDPKAVWTALSTLEHREDLPSQIVELIFLLEKQERLKDEKIRQVAQDVLQDFGKEL